MSEPEPLKVGYVRAKPWPEPKQHSKRPRFLAAFHLIKIYFSTGGLSS